MDDFVAVLRVTVEDYFTVRRRLEAVAEGLELTPQFSIVVDLAITYEPQRALRVRKGLVAPGEVDDREAPHADGARAVRVKALVVGPAMHEDPAHCGHLRRVGCNAVKPDDAVDAAHCQGTRAITRRPDAWYRAFG